MFLNKQAGRAVIGFQVADRLIQFVDKNGFCWHELNCSPVHYEAICGNLRGPHFSCDFADNREKSYLHFSVGLKCIKPEEDPKAEYCVSDCFSPQISEESEITQWVAGKLGQSIADKKLEWRRKISRRGGCGCCYSFYYEAADKTNGVSYRVGPGPNGYFSVTIDLGHTRNRGKRLTDFREYLEPRIIPYDRSWGRWSSSSPLY